MMVVSILGNYGKSHFFQLTPFQRFASLFSFLKLKFQYQKRLGSLPSLLQSGIYRIVATPPAPLNHVKIFKGWPPRDAFWYYCGTKHVHMTTEEMKNKLD